MKNTLLAMSSFELGEWRKFSRRDQTRSRRSWSLNSTRSRLAVSNPFLHFRLLLPDIDSGRGEGDFKDEDGAIDKINGNGGDATGSFTRAIRSRA